MTLQDGQGRSYEIEIAFVRFLGGYVVWVDDDPYLEGEPFLSKQAGWEAIANHLSGRG